MRPTWDETWMTVADTIAMRSRCVRRQAGCVIVSATNRLVAVGYNGPPRHMTYPSVEACSGDCGLWCPRATTGGTMSYDDCFSVHSEPNALMHADRSLMEGGTAYITSCPCYTCAKDLSNSGVARAVFRIGEVDRERHPEIAVEFLKRCRIRVDVVENVIEP